MHKYCKRKWNAGKKEIALWRDEQKDSEFCFFIKYQGENKNLYLKLKFFTLTSQDAWSIAKLLSNTNKGKDVKYP